MLSEGIRIVPQLSCSSLREKQIGPEPSATITYLDQEPPSFHQLLCSLSARNKTRCDFDEANSMFSMACEDRLVCGGSVFYFLWKRFNCETQASLPSEVPHVLHLDTASTRLGLPLELRLQVAQEAQLDS